MAGKGKQEATVEILELSRGRMEVVVKGTAPLIMNRMSEKAKRELLFPAKKKNAAARAASLKHEPLEEYRASVYRLRDDMAPTLLAVPAVMFRGALRSAALDLPGAYKTQVGRLTYVDGEWVSIYGVPQLYMSVVRSAGINKTPDIRTRAIIPEWSARFSVIYQEPIFNQQMVANLLAAAGEIVGIGDYRPEKGAGSYGRFALVAEEDAAAIVAGGGRQAQLDALADPVMYDLETEEMYEWFTAEVNRRGMKVVSA